MPLTANQILQERYEVVRSIKSGGMGAVYEAIDQKLASTPCAIKEVLCSALQGSNAQYVLNSFESEMRALANLDHPSIPRVRDYFEIDGRRYIVLDYVNGKPLDEELQEHLRLTNEPVDPYVAVLDMISVLETLAYLHGQRPPVVHRDIKPANLIRDSRNGRIKMVDFGIARSVESQQCNTSVGTPGFCAPEQAAGRAEPRSDLYSVGATLFNLVTGTMPPPFSFDCLEPDLPRYPGLSAIIKKATAVKPSGRYDDAEQMATALRNWAHGRSLQPVAAAAPAPRPAPPEVVSINSLARVAPPANTSSARNLIGIAVLLLASYALFPKAQQPAPLPAASPTTKPPQPPTPTVAASPLRKVVAAPAARPSATPAGWRPKLPPPRTAASRPPAPLAGERPRPLRNALARRQARAELPGAAYPQGVQPTGYNRPAPPPPAAPPATDSMPPAAQGGTESRYAEENGLMQLRQFPNHTLYGQRMGAYDLKLDVWRRPNTSAAEMSRLAPTMNGAPSSGRHVRLDVPPGQICYQDPRNPNHFFHFKTGLMLETRIENGPLNAVDWPHVQRIVDNWPSP